MSTSYMRPSSVMMAMLAYWAVNCSIRSMTAGVLSLGEPRGLNPLVPSGLLGWRTTVTWIKMNDKKQERITIEFGQFLIVPYLHHHHKLHLVAHLEEEGDKVILN